MFFKGILWQQMNNWKRALALALGLPSTILGVFFTFQELVKAGVVSQSVAQLVLLIVVTAILIKMIQVSWNKKK